jgi:hypothetical protein
VVEGVALEINVRHEALERLETLVRFHIEEFYRVERERAE